MLRAVLGDLVQTTDGKWITHPPTRCPNGHSLGPNQVLVGHVACLGHCGGGLEFSNAESEAALWSGTPEPWEHSPLIYRLPVVVIGDDILGIINDRRIRYTPELGLEVLGPGPATPDSI